MKYKTCKYCGKDDHDRHCKECGATVTKSKCNFCGIDCTLKDDVVNGNTYDLENPFGVPDALKEGFKTWTPDFSR